MDPLRRDSLRNDPLRNDPLRNDPLRNVRRWLVLVYLGVLGMVALGGVTRLTGSGLSMVAWEPLRVLPPMTQVQWEQELARYAESPQFRLQNPGMTLEEFRGIFWWEYLHRSAGRALGVVFFVPLLLFVWKRRLFGKKLRPVLGLLALGGAQAALGWWMVASGLVDRPEVSHFRLAAHLLLAFLVAHVALWLALSWRPDLEPACPSRALAATTWTTLALVVVQIAWGAFVAGKRGGLAAPTFPDFFGHYLPGQVLGADPRLLEDPLALHYVHRVLAFVLVPFVVGLGALAWRHVRLRRSALGVLLALVAQLVLGALVVLHHVPTSLAVAHQVVGFGVLSHLVAFAVRAGVLPTHGRVRGRSHSSAIEGPLEEPIDRTQPIAPTHPRC